MRSALRYALALAVFAVAPSSIVGAVGCGPSELFIGSFVVEGSRDGMPDADLDGDALNVILDAAAPLCEPQLGGRDASTLLRQFDEQACRDCALGSCCVAVTRCFPSEMNATTSDCTMHAQCITDCCRVGSDASADARAGLSRGMLCSRRTHITRLDQGPRRARQGADWVRRRRARVRARRLRDPERRMRLVVRRRGRWDGAHRMRRRERLPVRHASEQQLSAGARQVDRAQCLCPSGP